MDNLATTHDSIYQGKWLLEQPRKGYRFGTDAMVLAAAVQAKPGEKVLELGCGVGAVLLAAHARMPDVFLTGIERVPDYVELAKRNIIHNKVSRRINIFKGDLQNAMTIHSMGRFDHVIANPPYYEVGRHSGSITEIRRVARQQEPEALAEWIQAANRVLKPKGTVTFIHAAEKLDDLLYGMKRFCGGIRIFPLWPQMGKPSKRIVVQGIKGSKAPLTLYSGLVMHQEDGLSTERALEVINHGQSIWEETSKVFE